MKEKISSMDKSSSEKFERQVVTGSEKGQKLYSFNDQHDKTKPAQFWFQESHEGLVLFLVFYTLACRWSQCAGCNLPSKMSPHHIDFKSIMAQVDHIFNTTDIMERSRAIKKVIVSNNGSVLDEATFSSCALMYLMARLNHHLPNMSVLSIETRPEYVDLEELEFLSRALKEGKTPTELEICIGFEAFDDRVRNDIFNKGLSLETFEELVKKIAPYRYGLKCYFMQKPVPGITDKEAIEDIRGAIDYLSSIQKEHDIRINMHLNPTFVAKGTLLEEAFKKGNYSPPDLLDVAEAARHARDKNISVFIGLFDEGLAAEGGSFIKEGDEEAIARIEDFNRSGNFNILDNLCHS